MAPQRRILPPIWLGFCLAAELVFHFWYPRYVFATPFTTIAGIAILMLGLMMAAMAAGAFHRAGTPLVPFERSTRLVTDGWYRYTRNPMYLGMTLVLLGGGIALGELSALLPVPVFVFVMQKYFVLDEEKMLTELFGDDYRAYQRRVRRWL